MDLELIKDGDFEEQYNSCLKLFNSMVQQLKEIFEKFMMLDVIDLNHYSSELILINFSSRLKVLINNLYVFLNDKDFSVYSLSRFRGNTLYERMIRLMHTIYQINKNPIEMLTAVYAIEDLLEGIDNLSVWFNSYSQHVKTSFQHDQQIEILNKEIANSRALLQEINSQKTELIYSNASKKYLESARIYERLFYLIFFGAVILTIVSLVHFPHSSTDIVDYVLYKVLTVSVVVTTGTIFLRKASHLRKLHDQANQTSMELQALPLYLKNVKTEDHSEIYKELATKYFGKEVDQTQNDKIGDLLQDQVKISTELIKASAEIVKSVKPSGGTESSEPK